MNRYQIYNPDFNPARAFEIGTSSLQKNPIFMFLKTRLQEYYQNNTQKKKPTLYSDSLDQWKACLFKNLYSLLNEVVYTENSLVQQEMLKKIQNWFFNKMKLPSIATDLSVLSRSPLKQEILVPNSSSFEASSIISHSKYDFLDPKSKQLVAVMAKEKKKLETLSFGAADARIKILNKYSHQKMSNSSAITPTPDLDHKNILLKLPLLDTNRSKSNKRSTNSEDYSEFINGNYGNIINKKTGNIEEVPNTFPKKISKSP